MGLSTRDELLEMSETTIETPLLKLLMVEDLPHWQIAIQSVVEPIEQVYVVGCVDNYDAAMALWDEFPVGDKPNVALLDFQIVGDKTGLDVARALTHRGLAEHQIVMISSSSPDVIGEHPYAYIPKSKVVDLLPAVLEGIRNTFRA